MENKLHIKVIQETDDTHKFDASLGGLYLSKATDFYVTIKEYEDEKKKVTENFNKSQEEDLNKWKKRAAEGWTKEKLNQNWEANKKLREKVYNEALTTLKNKYQTVNWTWVVAPKKPVPAELYHNHTFSKGIPDHGKVRVTFQEIIAGGGMAYLEAYHEGDKPAGQKPFGLFVQAGGKPEILRVEWTDFDYNPLEKKIVAFGSEVLLHIYTKALYGQELKIQLFDRDIFSFNDELNISEKSHFEREVDIHKVHPNEMGKPGVADTLAKSEKDTTKDPNFYIQKIVIEVKVDYTWMKSAGENLKIYPTVKSMKTNTYFENFSRVYLDVALDGQKYDTPQEIVNKPVLTGQIETNIQYYHPCQYTAIDYTNDKDEITNIYTEQPGVSQPDTIEVGIVVGNKAKKFNIKVDDKSNTLDCRFDGKANDHEKRIFNYDKKKLPTNIKITDQQPKSITGEVFFDYNNINLFDYFFLTESKAEKLPKTLIKSETCRHQHNIYVKAIPDIRWEGYVLITSKTPESFSHTNMPSDKDSFGDPIVTDENGKPTRKNIFQIHQKKARETGIKAKKVNQDFTGEIHLKATYNDYKDSADYGAYIEDKVKLILDKISLVKGVLDSLSHRDEAEKGGAQNMMKSLKSSTKTSLPVFIEFSFPTVRLGGGWYWKYSSEEKKIKCIGNLQYGFEPLVQGKGGIDLVAGADYIPPVKPVLWALKYVKKGAQWLSNNTPVQIDAELYFNLYVKGKIDLRQTIDFYNSSYDKTEVKASLLLGIELGFKIKATIDKVIYAKNDKAGGEEIKKIGFDGQLSAEAESGFVVTGSGGKDDKGSYAQMTVDFTGITLKIVGKLTIYRPDEEADNYGLNKKFDLVDYKKDIIDPIRHDFI